MFYKTAVIKSKVKRKADILQKKKKKKQSLIHEQNV